MFFFYTFFFSFFFFFFFFNDTATTEIYTLSLHDALPIFCVSPAALRCWRTCHDLVLPLDTYWFGLGVAVGLEEVGYFEAEVAGIGGVGQRGVVIDCAGTQKFFQFTVEVLHAIGVAIAHGIEECLAFAFPFFHVIARA